MLGTNAVKQYFATGSSHYVLPLTSAEWNYNLFYSPYVTFSGNGSPMVINWKTPSNWKDSTSGAVATGVSYDGEARITTAFPSSVSHKSLKINSTGSTKSIKINTTYPSSTNTYKIVFFAKVVQDLNVNLSALTYVDAHRSHCVSEEIDSIGWKKFELYVSSRPVDTAYMQYDFVLDFTSEDGSVNYDVLIDQVEVYQTTAFEYQYGNLWQTSSPFKHFRPGESYVPSGNTLCQLPSNFRTINTKFDSSGINKWSSKVMPVSPVMYHPSMLGSAKTNPVFKDGVLSEYSIYRYFVSDGATNSIGAIYDQLLYANKLILKFNIGYSKPTIKVNISNTTNAYAKEITIPSTAISNSGLCVIYLQQDGTWTTTPWTNMPSFDLAGNIKFQNTAIDGGVYINKIVVTQMGTEINSEYSSFSASSKTLMQRLQVVEISPRIELDITYFTMNFDIRMELDNKNNPLPISAISANSASIQLSNIPLTVSSNVLSIFSNNATGSPLKGLFKKNVKFYLNYLIKDSVSGATASDKCIPAGVFYADTWDGQDIQKTNVVMYDASKYLQTLSPTDYVCYSESPFKIISNILDFAGYTDYDYDSLKRVSESYSKTFNGDFKNSHPLAMKYFYVDGQQQKVFDVLRELFEVYQIAAYIDAYGVMRFTSLSDILSNKTPNTILHDSKTPVVIASPAYKDNLTVTSNIVQDTYTEKVSAKVGKAVFRYKVPQVKKTPASAASMASAKVASGVEAQIQDWEIIWNSPSEEALTFNTLYESMNSLSQTYFQIDPAEIDLVGHPANLFRQFGINHEGYAIIEGEVVSFSDKEYKITIFANNDFTGQQYTKYYAITNDSELKSALSEMSAQSGFTGSMQYSPTGKIVNVKRGLYNTPVRKHQLLTDSNVMEKFDQESGPLADIDESNGDISLKVDSGNFINAKLIKNEISNGYNTFSTKIHIGPYSGRANYDQLEGGIFLRTTNYGDVHIGIRQDSKNQVKDKTGKIVSGYQLYVCRVTGPNQYESLLDKPFYTITNDLLNDIINFPPNSPFDKYGRYVNLKFVKRNDAKKPFEIYINKKAMNIKVKEGLASLSTDGQKFGIYAKSPNGQSGSINFNEVYATQSSIDTPNYYYHYQATNFADNLISNKKIFEINYMLQSRPEIIGINFYDVKNQVPYPSLTAEVVPIIYDWQYLDTINTSTKQNDKTPWKIVKVDQSDVSYSSVYTSGFRNKFALVNNSPCQIWVKKSPDYKNPINIDFSITSNTLIALSDEYVVEEIFDPSNTTEVIEIASNWVQSKKTALSILKTIFKAIDGFSRDTQISIYGNPLFEVGDVVKINYSLKNIVDQTYFVQGVQQVFDTGLKTIVTLNQIGISVDSNGTMR